MNPPKKNLPWPQSLHASAELARQQTETQMDAPTHTYPEPAPVMSVYDCIVAVSAELAHDGVAKTRKNAQQGYQFRGIDEVLNALSPLLAKHRLVILPRVLSRSVVERETKSGGALFYVTVEAEFDFVSAADGSSHTVKTYGEAMDSADKATNKAMSAAYKYAAFQTFCIPVEGDDDADSTTHEPKAGYSVKAPALPEKREKPAAATVETRGTISQSPDVPNLTPDPHDVPEGAVLIVRVDVTPTKNPNVKKYLITDSNGETYSTIREQLGSLCEQLSQERSPVTFESEPSKWGANLVAVHRVERTIQLRGDDRCSGCGFSLDTCTCGPTPF